MAKRTATQEPDTAPGARPQKKSERTRAAILQAAQAAFAEHGYDRATVRDIAARADVDPALVVRYFGGKDGLFAEASDFDLRLPDLAGAPRARLGETVIAHFLDVWEGSSSSAGMAILMRAASTNEEAAAKMRRIFASQVAPMLAKIADRAEVAARAGLISTQLLGLALCRYVLKLPPVTALSREQIIRSIGPTLQTYMTGKL